MRNSSKRLYLVVLALTVVVAIPFVAMYVQQKNCPGDYPDMIERGVLHVGMIQSPSVYCVADDSVSGYDYELLHMMARHAGVEIEIHAESSHAQCHKLLGNGICDFLAFRSPVTSAGREAYLYSRPVSLDKQVLVQRIDSIHGTAIRTQRDLDGCTLHIAQGDAARLRIANLAREIGGTIHIQDIPDATPYTLVEKVASGAIEYAVCDATTAAMAARTYSNIDCNVDISLTQFMSWHMRCENTILCDSIDSWLAAVQLTDDYKSLYTRYFGAKSYDKMCRITACDNVE